jgi:hypothetical protein
MVVVDGFEYKVSNRRDKKLQVWVRGRWIHFGQKGYQHYYDRTQLLPKSWNHKDSTRRANYLSRANGIKLKTGQRAANDPSSPNYHAIKILW